MRETGDGCEGFLRFCGGSVVLGLLPIHVDSLQIRHCLYEILVNAMEAIGDADGEIQVETGTRWADPSALALVWGSDRAAQDYAFVRVRDTGGGMTPVAEERAFEPFYSTRAKDRGAGLPAVLGIVRAHDGLIELANRQGHGCEITLYFPLDREGAASVSRLRN